MNVLCTFAGKYGDILWALPTVRALAWRLGEAVDLAVAQEFGTICQLIAPQPYIGHCVALHNWTTKNTAPISPRIPPGWPNHYDAVFHLTYRAWPQRPLPFETLDCLNAQSQIVGSKWTRFGTIPDSELALDEPWIHVEPKMSKCDLAIAFTDEYFELKFGLTCLVLEQFSRTNPDMTYAVLCPPRSRWATETWADTWRSLRIVDWQGYADIVAETRVVLADCSAAHVLAVGMGKPVVCMEPAKDRWQDIFWPFGKTGRVRLVTGGDGLPTWDARHVTDAIKEAMRA